jgi:hypothetical protein
MKNVRLVIIALALVFAASCVWAAAKQGEAQAQWWGPAPGQKPVVTGTVSNVSATNIAVQTREGVKSFTVDAKTKVGDRVIVFFKLVNDNVPLAISIVVPKPNFTGEIVSIQGNVIVIRERIKAQPGGKVRGRKKTPPYTLGPERKVLVTDTTKIRSHGYIGSLADLKIGMLINASGSISDQGMAADVIAFMSAVAKGTVIAINGSLITVKTVRQLDLSLQASPATAVLVRPRVGPNKKGTLEDVKVGMPVDVGFHPIEGGPAPLLWIDVLTGM